MSDSDIALMTGLDAIGRRWQAWLDLDHAARLLVDDPEDADETRSSISASGR
ncbi:hypothetical protein ACQB60_34425 [Actinomycetota bacterium Odt1-20B]